VYEVNKALLLLLLYSILFYFIPNTHFLNAAEIVPRTQWLEHFDGLLLRSSLLLTVSYQDYLICSQIQSKQIERDKMLFVLIIT
jgi:hypothetical protein